MLGYFRDPAATKAVRDEDGWLRTGDLGSRTADGALCWAGRMKDVLRVGGENVSAQEVEEVLMAHEDVYEAAVVGVADERLDEVPVAVVVPIRDSCIDIENLLSHCRQHLANFKVPREIRVVSSLPRTATEKVRRSELVSLFDRGTQEGASFPPNRGGGP